jgi:hypothetical protein
MKILKGVPSGSAQYLTGMEVPYAVEGGLDAFLDQNHVHIVVTSAFGTMSFHRDDKDLVTQGLISLAEMIERNVIL